MGATARLFLFWVGHNVSIDGILLPRIRDEREEIATKNAHGTVAMTALQGFELALR
jgi:hypothetical protein